MPLIGTKGAASAQGFGMFSASQRNFFFLDYLRTQTNEFTPRSVVSDSDGSAVFVGTTTSNQAAIMKISSGGTIINFKRMVPSGGLFSGQSNLTGVCLDGQGGYIISGAGGSSSTGSFMSFIARLDSNLNVLWARAFGSDPIGNMSSRIIPPAVDGSTVVQGFTWFDGTNNYSGLAANSLGSGSSLGGARQLASEANVNYCNGVCVVGSNYYLIGDGNSNPDSRLLFRFNSSFSLQETRSFTNTLGVNFSTVSLGKDGSNLRVGLAYGSSTSDPGSASNLLLSGASLSTTLSSSNFGISNHYFNDPSLFSPNNLISFHGYRNTGNFFSFQSIGAFHVSRTGATNYGRCNSYINNTANCIWGFGQTFGGTNSYYIFKLPLILTPGSATVYAVSSTAVGGTASITNSSGSPNPAFSTSTSSFQFTRSMSFSETNLVLNSTKYPYV